MLMLPTHPLIHQLSKLKESSKEAIADAQLEIEDDLKKYLHVERSVETDLKMIITEASTTDTSCLIMVCGNVGDGKSHLLSKIGQDSEMFVPLGSFKIHNDATESFSPDQTCIQTLQQILSPFSDDNILASKDKWILAINLGTLSNFLEENVTEYSKLKEFVEKNGIINPDKFEIRDKFLLDSQFQFVNFTNHHFYDLTHDGVKATLIEKILEKVVNPSAINPIFRAYNELSGSDSLLMCPVRTNFEFLSLEHNRKVIAKLLVECILKEKLIISFRQILNFIHDILVPFELSNLGIEEYKANILSLSPILRLEYHIVNYLFERAQLSKIFSSFFKLDPSIRRYEKLDEKAIALFTSMEPLQIFIQDFPDISFQLRTTLKHSFSDQNILFKFYLRLNYFVEYQDSLYSDDHFQSFAKALYFSNIKDASGLKDVNELVKNAALLWNGSTLEKNKIMFSNLSRHSSYRLFRNIQFRSSLPSPVEKVTKEILHQFQTEVKVQFLIPNKLDNTKNNLIGVDVDYSLFVLLQKVNQGYRPNKLDRNSFINFVTMVDNLIYENSDSEELFIDEVNIGYHLDYKLELDEYNEFQFTKLNKPL
ncbi:MAG: phosphorothioation-dependent restriction protein DptF [Sphingobacteriales bacterium]|nr:phosphorothioation-dependent restriction protein DptF [Sphingobacteriales bacterium]